MRAIRIHGYGGPEALRLEEVPLPIAARGERLVRLRAASVNPIDWKIREGLLKTVFPLALPRILGRDGAGIDVASGERVMGLATPGRDGTHAEYAVFAAGASQSIPEGVSDEQAAALGVAGLSAWVALVETAQVCAGVRVLVHAGAGGVGSIALQLARLLGAEVWTTCSACNADWCRALGAQHAIDYATEDFAALGRVFDIVLDVIGGAVHRRSAEVLKPGGALVYLNAAPPQPIARDDVRVLAVDVRPTPERLARLLALAADGRLRVPIEARFPLARAAEAYELSRSGHARGKIVLTMD